MRQNQAPGMKLHGQTCKDMEKAVMEAGWRYSHAAGGHRFYEREGESHFVVIPWHRRNEMAPKTVASILRQAGLKN
jgi:predicted RNA binding protein YcfA (HicA-like mRNA interferase family)